MNGHSSSPLCCRFCWAVAVNPIYGDPLFRNPGGLETEDYIPTNRDLIQEAGIAPVKLPGDSVGLKIGLEVERDIPGNPIRGMPDIGAIEIQP